MHFLLLLLRSRWQARHCFKNHFLLKRSIIKKKPFHNTGPRIFIISDDQEKLPVNSGIHDNPETQIDGMMTGNLPGTVGITQGKGPVVPAAALDNMAGAL